MASRCIDALNELDAISDKIFYKYSKVRKSDRNSVFITYALVMTI
jgi:hypothetical protein